MFGSNSGRSRSLGSLVRDEVARLSRRSILVGAVGAIFTTVLAAIPGTAVFAKVGAYSGGGGSPQASGYCAGGWVTYGCPGHSSHAYCNAKACLKGCPSGGQPFYITGPCTYVRGSICSGQQHCFHKQKFGCASGYTFVCLQACATISSGKTCTTAPCYCKS